MSSPVRTVLVVDDDEDTSLLLGVHLRRHGWEPTFASTLAQATTALQNGAFAALITDLRLPDGSGLSLLANARPATLRAAVVMTGGRGDAQRRDSERGGFDAYVLKPFDVAQLVGLLEARLAATETPLAPLATECARDLQDGRSEAEP